MIVKVVVRNLIKRPFLHLVKVIGLSLALVGILFITLFLKNELSYDSYHTNAENIYRYTITDPDFLGGKHFARMINPGYVPELKEQIPEITNFVRLRPVSGGVMKFNNRFYTINQAFECDSTFFQFFEAELRVGNKETILENPASMVVAESFAGKVFGNENPIGKILTIPTGQFYGEEQSFTINGVMKDFPSNSHFHPDFIATPVQDRFTYGWAWTYLALAENANPDNVRAGIHNFLVERTDTETQEMDSRVYLQKLTDIHLHSNKLREIEANGNIRNIYVLAIAALILLLISISNYANLNIGMAGFSAKYLFVNKLLGSSKRQIIRYFFTEGLFIAMATLMLALLVVPPVNAIIQRGYQLNLLAGNLSLAFIVFLVFILLSVSFGMLPVLKPVFSAIKGVRNNSKTNQKQGGINRGILVFQYAFSIALIISVIVISRQTNFAFKSGMGVEEDNVIVFESVHASIQQKFETLKEELLKYNSIQSVSAMMEPPGGEANDMFEFELEGYTPDEQNEQYERIGVFPCDYSFASLFNLSFLSGTNFTKNNLDNEGSGEYIINEAAMKRLNYSNAEEIVGKEFKLNFEQLETTGIKLSRGKIIGVVKDFHLSSLKKEVEPLVLFKRDKLWLINFIVAFQPGKKMEALADMKTVWTLLFPEYPFQYESVGSMYQKVYKAELLQAKLLSVFTFIALFICSMGLFGLALIVTQQRTKEIGVRKVNGARVTEIIQLLNRDFIRWVVLAFVFACPVAWFAMDKWLENFAYKISLSWWIFVLAGILAVGIALLTVSFQSWKAATQNPVEALRYE
ncbi:ABC transporter permease [Prolixibacteraceae bacterium Z1-6]|uniref:ABC transporter permease n=1 Tax=Draconibacterium aestuarii TaxID=2998507 RepID=A0A9X3J5B2_9BACT|nr:ABC transporter permease [Prolixibacteraceae bacterium Z1-6]